MTAAMLERLQRDLTASGVRLRVMQQGQGLPVVLLHGMFSDASTWHRLSDALSGEFHLVAPDLPGFGESEKPSAGRFPYGIPAFAGTIADLFAGLGLGRAAVVGHGLGGAVALTLAARHSELVSRLVLVDALCYATAPALHRKVFELPVVGGFVFKQLWGRTAFRTFYRDHVFAPGASVPLHRIDHYYESFNTPAARGSALATLRATADTRTVEAQTPRIAAPTLVVWGRQDRLYPAALGQRLARQIRGAGLALMSTGHAPQEEAPDELAEILRRFFRDQRA